MLGTITYSQLAKSEPIKEFLDNRLVPIKEPGPGESARPVERKTFAAAGRIDGRGNVGVLYVKPRAEYPMERRRVFAWEYSKLHSILCRVLGRAGA
ncbi:MAG: hypothetical protein Q9169_006115 [Polycauliona sp. 2 TL-2023]